MSRSLALLAVLASLCAFAFAQPNNAALVKSLADAQDRNKITILRTLAKANAPEAYDAFCYYIGYGRTHQIVNPVGTDITCEVRMWAARGLAAAKKKESLPLLSTYLNEERDWNVLMSIIQAIGEVGDPKAIPYLTRYLLTTSDMLLAHNCVIAISKMKDNESLVPLLEVMKGPFHYQTKLVAKEALKNLGWTEDLGYN